MANSMAENYQIRRIILREWQQKTDPAVAANKIASKLKYMDFITSTNIQYYYDQFDEGDTNIFGKDPPLHSIKYGTKNVINLSFLLIDNNDDDFTHYVMEQLTNDGRFLFSIGTYFSSKQVSITVHDLFLGNKRVNYVSFNAYRSKSRLIGGYLFLSEPLEDNDDFFKLHVLKINYNDLTVKELKTSDIKINDNFDIIINRYDELMADQLNTKNFGIFSSSSGVVYQIEDDKVIAGDVKTFTTTRGIDLDNTCLVGGKLLGFDDVENGDSLKFIEIDLDTMERKVKPAPMNLDDDELVIDSSYTEKQCWRRDRFYGLFETGIHYIKRLLMFDSLTLKWTDLKISTQRPQSFYIDENEIMTISANIGVETFSYRVALRKPDKLSNLARLAAARESCVYKNDKYINVSRQINFLL